MSDYIRYLIWLGLVWVLLVGLLGPGCGVSGSGAGRLEVRIRDHREAIEDFDELWLSFAAVSIHPVGQPRSQGWIELELAVPILDLTQYVDGREVVIAAVTAEPGSYNAIRLTVAEARGTLTDKSPAEVEVNLGAVALDFQIRQNHTTVVELDLMVLDLSDHPGQGYELHLREAMVQGDE